MMRKKEAAALKTLTKEPTFLRGEAAPRLPDRGFALPLLPLRGAGCVIMAVPLELAAAFRGWSLSTGSWALGEPGASVERFGAHP